MSDPFSGGAVAVWPLGPGQSTDNVTGLAAGTARGLGSIGTAGLLSGELNVAPIQITTGSVVNGGQLELYLFISEDGSLFSCGVNPNAITDQSAFLKNAGPLTVIQTIEVPAGAANTAFVFDGFGLLATRGYWSYFVAIGIGNKTDAALNATAANHSAKYALVSYA